MAGNVTYVVGDVVVGGDRLQDGVKVFNNGPTTEGDRHTYHDVAGRTPEHLRAVAPPPLQCSPIMPVSRNHPPSTNVDGVDLR
jgi:hypothetical protein